MSTTLSVLIIGDNSSAGFGIGEAMTSSDSGALLSFLLAARFKSYSSAGSMNIGSLSISLSVIIPSALTSWVEAALDSAI